jgi:hypothetical protein
MENTVVEVSISIWGSWEDSGSENRGFSHAYIVFLCSKTKVLFFTAFRYSLKVIGSCSVYTVDEYTCNGT